jgi:hypothetical protein
MLLEDFGDGLGNDFFRAINSGDIYSGMRKWVRLFDPNQRGARNVMANSQWYFFDCCRQYSSDLDDIRNLTSPPVWNEEIYKERDQRKTVRVFSAFDGGEALAEATGYSRLSKALLECLDGKVAGSVEIPPEGGSIHNVTIQTLVAGLNKQLEGKVVSLAMGNAKISSVHTHDK